MKELDDLRKVYMDGLITRSEYLLKIIAVGSSKLAIETQCLYEEADESMIFRKVECKYGWIVFIVKSHRFVEVHSNGLVHIGRNFKITDMDLLRLLEHTALSNGRMSQKPGKCGVRWPEEEEDA